MLCVRDSSKFQGPAIDVVLATTPACQRDATLPGAHRTARPNRRRSLVVKWNDDARQCRSRPRSSGTGRSARSSRFWPSPGIRTLCTLCPWYGDMRGWHGIASQIGQSLAPTKGTDGGGRIECDPCPHCIHAADDRGRTPLPGKGMALSERGIEALERPLEHRTRRPQPRTKQSKRTVCCGTNASH